MTSLEQFAASLPLEAEHIDAIVANLSEVDTAELEEGRRRYLRAIRRAKALSAGIVGVRHEAVRQEASLRVAAGGGSITTARTTSPFAETLLDLLDRVEYRRVSPGDQFDPVYRLRYEAYRREAFVAPNDQQVVRDEFDELPNAYTFGVYIDDRLVSSVRFHYMTPEFRTAPSHSVFTDVLDPMLDRGDTMIDPGRFTTDYEAALAYPALPYLTLRIPTMAVRYFNVRYVLSSVRPEHAAFYRRVYRSQQLAGPRYYHGLTFPMVLLACEIPVMYEAMLNRYPFFRSTSEERRALFGSIGKVPIVHPARAREAQERIREFEYAGLA